MTLHRCLVAHRFSVSAVVLSVCALLALGGVAGASDRGTPERSTPVGTHVGSLSVLDAFLPAPASPSVAAIYLTVKNAGSRADALVGVQSTVANSTMLMTENADGSMGMLTQLRIPPHGEASLVPGRDHLMLEKPSHALSLGQRVLVTLHFRRAGYLTISVPVVPLSEMVTRR
jgi:periplasmic copper chaperone A